MYQSFSKIAVGLFICIALITGCSESGDNLKSDSSDDSFLMSQLDFYVKGTSLPDNWTERDQEVVENTMRDSIERYTGENKDKYEEALRLIQKKNTTDVEIIYNELKGN